MVLPPLLLLVGCHDGGVIAANSDPGTTQGTGGNAPNGADPKQTPIRATPSATIPATVSNNVPTLGVGIDSSFIPIPTTIFAPVYQFAQTQNTVDISQDSSTGTRSHGEANSWSVGVSGGSPFFSAAVRYRAGAETFLSESSRDFQGYIRLVTQRDYISVALGHVALTQDVQDRLARAAQARQQNNLGALLAEREAFEQAYGLGFVSEHVRGHSAHMRAYGNETASNSSAYSGLSVAFQSAFISGGFQNQQQLSNAVSAAAATLRVNGVGLIQAPTDIPGFFAMVPNFNNNLGSPEPLWAGITAYASLTGILDDLYLPFAGYVDQRLGVSPIPKAQLSLPTLGSVGQLTSLESYSSDISKTVWLAPYLFPGAYSTFNGNITIEARPFDLIKILSKDTAFINVGETFLAARGYPVEHAARLAMMPFCPGGTNSIYPEVYGDVYHINVERLRPVLSIYDPQLGTYQEVAPLTSHWKPVGPMQLDDFGVNVNGLFLGSTSLVFSYPDPNGAVVSAAQAGRLYMGTEASIGTTSVILDQRRLVTGSLGVAFVPPQPGQIVVFPATPKALLLRLPINWDETSPVYRFPAAFGSSMTCFGWQAEQNITMHAQPYWWQNMPGGPVFDCWNSLGQSIVGSVGTLIGGDRVSIDLLNFSTSVSHGIYSNRSSTGPSNWGSYQDVLVLGQ